MLADGDSEGEAELLGLTLGDGETDDDSDELGEIEAEGDTLLDGDSEGDSLLLGEPGSAKAKWVMDDESVVTVPPRITRKIPLLTAIVSGRLFAGQSATAWIAP